jgi:cytochrome P450
VLFALGGASHNWRGPGEELYRAEPAFRACVDSADERVRETLHFSSTAMFKGEWKAECAEDQRRSDIVNMGLLHLGLIDLWEANGIRPDGVLGLSLGEVGAAYASGAIDRETAIRIYCTLARNIDARSDEHILFVVGADADEAQRLCAESPAALQFAGEPVPGTSALLIPVADAAEVRAHLRGRAPIHAEHETKWPYHVATVPFDPAATLADLAEIRPGEPKIPVYLASLGSRVEGGHEFGPAHWPAMVTGSYFLAGATRAAFADGYRLMVNIGTASIGAWVAEAAPLRADIRRFDATPGGAGAEAWKRPIAEVRALQGLRAPPARAAAGPVDLSAPDILANPFPAYEQLRAAGPVQFLPRQNFWIVLGYDSVAAALRDTECLSNRSYAEVGPVLMAEDPPAHLQVRRLVSSLFAPARTERLADGIGELAPQLIGNRFDLVTGYARPLAESAACELLAIPPEAASLFQNARHAYHEQAREMTHYIARLDALAARAGAFGDLFSRGDGLLSEERTRRLVRFLWMAATETTERVVVRAILVLLQDPALRQRLEEGWDRLEAFVDEVLRLYPAEMMIPRTAVAALRLGGADIPAGDHVMLCLAAANRDPARFEDPACFRLDRPPGRHLSFGAGIHKCSGTAMSRPIIIAALQSLLRHAPRLRADEPLDKLSYCTPLTALAPRRLRVAR